MSFSTVFPNRFLMFVFLPNPTGCPLHHLASQGTAMGFGPYKRYANVSCHGREGKIYRKPCFLVFSSPWNLLYRFFCILLHHFFHTQFWDLSLWEGRHTFTCYARSLPPKDGKQTLYVGICGIFAFGVVREFNVFNASTTLHFLVWPKCDYGTWKVPTLANLAWYGHFACSSSWWSSGSTVNHRGRGKKTRTLIYSWCFHHNFAFCTKMRDLYRLITWYFPVPNVSPNLVGEAPLRHAQHSHPAARQPWKAHLLVAAGFCSRKWHLKFQRILKFLIDMTILWGFVGHISFSDAPTQKLR